MPFGRLASNNNSLDLYDPGTGTWSIVGAADYSNIDSGVARQYEYPRLHVLPDGSVVSVSTMTNGNLEKWHPYTDATDWDHVIGPAPDPMYGGFAQDTTSVLLPLKASDKFRAQEISPSPAVNKNCTHHWNHRCTELHI